MGTICVHTDGPTAPALSLSRGNPLFQPASDKMTQISTPIWCRGWCHSTTHPTGSSLRCTADWCPQQEPCGRVGWGLVKHREFFSHWVKSVHKDPDRRSHPRKQPYFLTKFLVRWGESLKLHVVWRKIKKTKNNSYCSTNTKNTETDRYWGSSRRSEK